MRRQSRPGLEAEAVAVLALALALVLGLGALTALLPEASSGASSPSSPLRSATDRAALACSVCGRNLIANPGAETGKGTTSDSVVKVPDWKGTGSFTAAAYAWPGGDLSATTPGPPNRGKNYFYGGPSALRSTGTQTIKLAAGSFAPGARYTLAAWLGGYFNQGDYCQLSAKFETSTGASLGVVKIGPVTAQQRHHTSELLYRGVAGKVPARTRQIVITMLFVLEVGGDNDGMADNLSLVVTKAK